ncbi:MAG TPA: hypothetical protein VI636_16090 [Candidatus Angelobacter sp.]
MTECAFSYPNTKTLPLSDGEAPEARQQGKPRLQAWGKKNNEKGPKTPEG